jgi:hypothetical protein
MNEQDLINAVRNHALQTYEADGWDYVVECWSDGDILECLDGAETVAQAIANVREALRRWQSAATKSAPLAANGKPTLRGAARHADHFQQE